jgi:hypothetical protein
MHTRRCLQCFDFIDNPNYPLLLKVLLRHQKKRVTLIFLSTLMKIFDIGARQNKMEERTQFLEVEGSIDN